MNDINKPLWCVALQNAIKDIRGNIEGHIWKTEKEASAQAEALAQDGKAVIVYEMKPIASFKVQGVVKELLNVEAKKDNLALASRVKPASAPTKIKSESNLSKITNDIKRGMESYRKKETNKAKKEVRKVAKIKVATKPKVHLAKKKVK